VPTVASSSHGMRRELGDLDDQGDDVRHTKNIGGYKNHGQRQLQ